MIFRIFERIFPLKATWKIFFFLSFSFPDRKAFFPAEICKNGFLNYFCGSKGDSVAQLVEHNTFNVGVPGSSPGWITS